MYQILVDAGVVKVILTQPIIINVNINNSRICPVLKQAVVVRTAKHAEHFVTVIAGDAGWGMTTARETSAKLNAR